MRATTSPLPLLLAGVAVATASVAASGCSSDTRRKRAALQASAAAAVTSDGEVKTKPKLKRLDPDAGDLAGGDIVVIEGKRFLAADAGTTRVLFGNVAVEVTPARDDELWVTTPPGLAPGPVDVTIVNAHGADVLPAGFVYALPRKTKPKLEALRPDRGPATGGTVVVLEGKRFLEPGAGETLVLFGTERVVAQARDDGLLEVVAPASLRGGPVTVRVVNEHGMDAIAGGFTYEPASEWSRHEPTVGRHDPVAGGTRVVVTTSFVVGPAAQVTFDGVPAASVAVLGSYALAAAVPAGLRPGLVDVAVEEGGRRAVQTGFRVQGPLAYGDLLLNELLPDASQLDANGDGVAGEKTDEFVELVNPGVTHLDLSGLELLDGSGEVRHRFPNPTTLPPGGALAVFGGGTPVGFAAPHASGHAQVATSGGLGLSDDQDEVVLRAPDGTVLFRFVYDDAKKDTSWNRKKDGEQATADPARLADLYKKHEKLDDAAGRACSPGRRAGGGAF